MSGLVSCGNRSCKILRDAFEWMFLRINTARLRVLASELFSNVTTEGIAASPIWESAFATISLSSRMRPPPEIIGSAGKVRRDISCINEGIASTAFICPARRMALSQGSSVPASIISGNFWRTYSRAEGSFEATCKIRVTVSRRVVLTSLRSAIRVRMSEAGTVCARIAPCQSTTVVARMTTRAKMRHRRLMACILAVSRKINESMLMAIPRRQQFRFSQILSSRNVTL